MCRHCSADPSFRGFDLRVLLLGAPVVFAAGRVSLRAHRFRFLACTASGLPSAGWFFCLPFRRLPLGELAFGLTTSAFRPAPLRSCPRRVGFRVHCFRFSACTASEWPLGEFVLPPSVSEIALGGLAFGLTASAFRHAPLRGCPRRVGSSAFRFGDCPRRVGLRAHCFRFSARTASGLPSASWFYRLPLRRLPLGRLAFGLTASAFRRAPFRGCRSASWFFCLPLRRLPLGRLVLPLGGLAFGLTTSAFRHAPLRSCRSASWRFRSASWFFCLPFRRLPLGGLGFGLTLRGCPRRVGLRAHGFRFSARTASELPSAGWRFRLPFRRCRSASWPSGSLLPLFGTHRSAPPHRRSEDRRSTTTRHLFHFKTLIPTC